jgi:C4-dicarboxylate-specific signal transduction histidine kinase
VDQGSRATTLIVVTDITAEKSSRERLRDLQDQLSRVQRLKTVGEMSASLAHELGQPLGAISAFVGSCQHQLATDHWEPEQLQEQLRRIERAATRAGEILKRFRAYGRNTSLQPLTLDLPALIGEVQELCGPLLKESQTSLQCRVAQPLPVISGDPLLIQQVLMNLIQNSVQALDGAPPERCVISLIVGEGDGGAGVQLTVADRGNGIPSELLPRLTEPFFTTRANGLGLGLSICRTIIEDHEGRLCVTSEAGVGTTVRLLLPAVTPEAAHV